MIIGTLAHEFQHMIHFYQKPVLRDTGSPAWLNEMSSEVAQDLIADKLMDDGPRGVAYDDPTAGEPDNLRGRLPEYNFFNDIRVTSWEGDIANYSINYALGAYLARTYGAALFSDIVQSDGHGVDAIEGALDGLGRDVSFGDVLANWAAATLLSDNTAAPAPYRYNTGTWTTSHAGGNRVPAGIDRPVQLRVPAAGRVAGRHRPEPDWAPGLLRAVPALPADLQRAHAAAALQHVRHHRARHRDRPPERQRPRRQPHHRGGQGMTGVKE